MSKLENLVRSHIHFESDVQIQTFPMAYEDAKKWIVYHGYRHEKVNVNIVVNDMLCYMQHMYGYTVMWDQKRHGDNYVFKVDNDCSSM